MVDLVVNRNVDVVNMSIGGLPALNDGNNARAELYDRLINDYGVQMFISAGNSGPGVNTIGDPSVATDVVSVAASVSKETWLANYGSVVRKQHALFNFSSRGPREDGGFKPNITAPGSAISTDPDVAGRARRAARPATRCRRATRCSTAPRWPPRRRPAARRCCCRRPRRPTGASRRPRCAGRIYTSADADHGRRRSYGQGNGHAGRPRRLEAADASDVETRSYTVDAPVCTPLSEFLATPNRGTGIYNRCAADAGGHKPGQTKTTRSSSPAPAGRAAPIKHRPALGRQRRHVHVAGAASRCR